MRVVHPINGDLTIDGLGISHEDMRIITKETQVVVNCAASVDFNLQLDQSVVINIEGAL